MRRMHDEYITRKKVDAVIDAEDAGCPLSDSELYGTPLSSEERARRRAADRGRVNDWRAHHPQLIVGRTTDE